eukprot:scaffold20.g7718.t1
MVVLAEGACLYAALGVEKTADQAAIRKAYLRLAVTCHPDKHPDDPQANERFQTLQKVYGILSDAEKRKVYDTTGSWEDAEQLSGEAFNQLVLLVSAVKLQDSKGCLPGLVTEEDIERFEAEYRGSAEEAGDLLAYYTRFQGDMGQVFEWVMCSDPARDSHRFMDALNAAIKERRVKSFKRYAAWAKCTAAAPRPADPLAPRGRSAAEHEGERALVAAIRGRQRSALGGTLDAIAARYGVAPEGGACPTEEEFEAARTRLEARRGGGGKAKAKAAGGGGGAKKKQKRGKQ